MESYYITYHGSDERLKNLRCEVKAWSEKEAIEKVKNEHFGRRDYPDNGFEAVEFEDIVLDYEEE
jgi:hypothetical protein